MKIQPQLSPGLRATSPLRPAGSSQPCSDVTDIVQIGKEPPTCEKDAIIRSMIRRSPDESCDRRVVEALSAYPIDALKRVQAYGTRIEVYDFAAGESVPNYLPTLANPNTLGAYNTRANVLGVDRGNLSAFTLLHEFAHALDESLGEVSARPEWKGAQAFASNTNRVVRDYCKQDSAEYLAENMAAYLVSDDALFPLIERGLKEEVGLEGLSERQYMQMHQNYCTSRLRSVDPDGYAMIDDLINRAVTETPPREPIPAFTEEQWITTLKAEGRYHES